MPVFLIRHPRPLIADGVCYGQLDVDCEDPLPLAARIAPLLPAGIPVFTSPLIRARRLAEALHPAPHVDTRLAEISFGDWEGKRWDDIARQQIDDWAADVLHFIPPGGESVAMLQARAIEFAGELTNIARELPASAVAIVAHAGVLRALVGHWRRLSFAEWSRLAFDFASVTVVALPHETSA